MPYIAAVFCVIMVAAAPFAIRKNWSGTDEEQFDYMTLLVPATEGVKRGVNRSMSVILVAAAVMCACALVALIPGKLGAEIPDSVLKPVVFGSLGIMLPTAFVIVPSIVLFNRPKFLVPPAYRKQLGLCQVWVRRMFR
ncbi:hypothetical protein [Streptomyces sp. NPDC091371]|uniref:hypothetical protein n=1 Tax=Streptomyces sp. NPDC091371 TaxID=3155303 RepID=UPI0034258DAE